MEKYERIQKILDIQDDSVFLWGARQVGKSTLVKKLFPDAKIYDLLKSDEYSRLLRRPQLLREELMSYDETNVVVIDEIQKIPALLDEVHWLIVNRGIRFVLCGSSARKLKRVGTNLLGGRALPVMLFPFVSAEIPDFDLFRAINNGMIPRHYMVQNPQKRLEAYIGVYLKEEIQEEAVVRQLSSFNRFLDVAAQCDGEMINYTNIAQDCGVSATTIKEYFNILEQTLIGYMVPAFTLSKKRRAITTKKFYYFDVGVANYLMHRHQLEPGTPEYGHAFEHLVMQEIIAYLGYKGELDQLSYWHAYTGEEVDAIIGDARIAIEMKSTDDVQRKHLSGLKDFSEEHPDAKLILVSRDKVTRRHGNIDLYYATDFFKSLWNGEII